jgi:hypothetical protein
MIAGADMSRHIVSAFSSAAVTERAAQDIITSLQGFEPALLIFFTSSRHDGLEITKALRAFAPNARITGCSTAGEFTDKSYTTGSISVLAFSRHKVKRVATALATYELGVENGVLEATRSLSRQLGCDLRELDPTRHVGLIFDEALHFREDEVNEILGHAAPLLSFVGGSAADDWQMKAARVYDNGRSSEDGCVLTLIELDAPYAILKTSSFESSGMTMRLDRAHGREVYEMNGRTALEAYAAAVGRAAEALDHQVFMANPLGVMIEGEPWVRSVIGVLPNGGLNFGARMIEGTELQLLRYTDLVGDTSRALAATASQLGKPVQGAVLFNCAHRCLAINARKLQEPFASALGTQGYPLAGFHCYGEDWLAHLNQTLVGVLFA